jgi:CBS domain containing-hemolysin-like protein
MRHEVGSAGDLLWGLSVAGTAAAVIGWFMVGGVAVAMAEGGSALTTVPHPVVYLVSEISNLVAVCASAFLIGLAALVLGARSTMPTPLRVLSYVAGMCGILGPVFFPIFVFWLWTVVTGAWLAATASRSAAPASREVLPA